MLLRRINGKKASPTPRHKHPQSHNGAIAAFGEPSCTFAQRIFQSHNGAIAARLGRLKGRTKGTFNPTMVRLLLVVFDGRDSWELAFNPTMVRLLPR